MGKAPIWNTVPNKFETMKMTKPRIHNLPERRIVLACIDNNMYPVFQTHGLRISLLLF